MPAPFITQGMSGNDHRNAPSLEQVGARPAFGAYDETPRTERPGAMPVESQTGRPLPAPLGSRVTQDADPSRMADAVLTVWAQIDDALHPIIGRRGVAALYNRSLKVTAASYAWLGGTDGDALADRDPATLRAALVGQTSTEAAAGALALFQAFRDLLASLVGASLTDRLLQPVWAPPSGDPPVQDTLK